MKYLISVLLIVSIVFYKEMWNIFFSQFFAKKQKAIPPQRNQESVVALSPVVSVPEVAIPYEVFKEGAERIIYTTLNEGNSELRLYSYIYANGMVRRVVVDGSIRTPFMTCKMQSISSESEDFKAAYTNQVNIKLSPDVLKPSLPKPVIDDSPVEKKPVAEYEGKILSFGFTSYQNNGVDTGNESYAVDITTADGPKTLYGKDLERAIADAKIHIGDMAHLTKYSRIPVVNTDSGKTVKINPWVAVKVLS